MSAVQRRGVCDFIWFGIAQHLSNKLLRTCVLNVGVTFPLPLELVTNANLSAAVNGVYPPLSTHPSLIRRYMSPRSCDTLRCLTEQ